MPQPLSKRWSAGLAGRLTAQYQRRKAAMASVGVTKITLSKGGVTESRRMDLSTRGAKKVQPMAYWVAWLSEGAGLTEGQAHRLLVLLEERFVFPACFVIAQKLFWAECEAGKLLRLAKAYGRCNADDSAFIDSTFVRNFKRTLRKETSRK